MKNLFYSLAFVLIGSFAFANNSGDCSISNQIKNELASIEKFNNLNLESFSFEENQINEDLLECHVTIKGTINGKKVDIDVTFTSDSGSCIKDTVKLLQEL
ncbi:MAG: hypothetical protein HC854_04720 [Flavobacterium sp.]|nr:hypothetical protein [Flavobacterium sp.]